jgi:DNA-directed RNA polymerase specialized sigma24 family protein
MTARKPDARKASSVPATYARTLVDATGLTQVEVSQRLGCSERTLRNYVSGALAMSYTFRIALEALAGYG